MIIKKNCFIEIVFVSIEVDRKARFASSAPTNKYVCSTYEETTNLTRAAGNYCAFWWQVSSSIVIIIVAPSCGLCVRNIAGMSCSAGILQLKLASLNECRGWMNAARILCPLIAALCLTIAPCHPRLWLSLSFTHSFLEKWPELMQKSPKWMMSPLLIIALTPPHVSIYCESA